MVLGWLLTYGMINEPLDCNKTSYAVTGAVCERFLKKPEEALLTGMRDVWRCHCLRKL